MTTGRAARGVAVLVAVVFSGLLILGSHLGPASSTETRYSEMGREMLVSGDWVVPRLNGAPLLEKPPFEYWVNAASFAVFGVSDLSNRVPSLVAGILTLLLVGAIARRLSPALEGPEVRATRGTLAVLALVTMPGFVVQSYTISTDVWLVLVTTVAGLCLLESLRTEGRPGLKWVLLLHAATGLGMLIKGPLTFGLVFGVGVAVAIARKSARHLRPFAHPLGLLLFAAIAVPWYVLANQRIPGLLHDLVTRRLFGGIASSKDFHSHSWWVVWLPLFGAFPWLATLPSSIRAFAGRGEWRRGLGLPMFLLAAAAPVLFTVSRARLPSYTSPAFPWLAILCALGAPLGSPAGSPTAPWTRQLRRAALGVAVVAAGTPVLSLAVGDDGLFLPACLVPAFVGVLGAVVSAVLCWKAADLGAAIPRAALASAFLTLAIAGSAASAPMRAPALKPLWLAIEAHRKPGEELGVALPYTGDWGLLPWYSRSVVRYFDYPSEPMIVRPEDFSPQDFRPREAILPWFSSPERRWFMTRERDLRGRGANYLAGEKLHTVATGGGYEILTNLPLPGGER